VKVALDLKPRRALELGVGSGCISAALLRELPSLEVVAVDVSAAALELARENLAALGVLDRVQLVQADGLSEVAGAFDLVVSNPPYVETGALPGLAPSCATSRNWRWTADPTGSPRSASSARPPSGSSDQVRCSGARDGPGACGLGATARRGRPKWKRSTTWPGSRAWFSAVLRRRADGSIPDRGGASARRGRRERLEELGARADGRGAAHRPAVFARERPARPRPRDDAQNTRRPGPARRLGRRRRAVHRGRRADRDRGALRPRAHHARVVHGARSRCSRAAVTRACRCRAAARSARAPSIST
jgi:SAM-dependent methyltransferase